MRIYSKLKKNNNNYCYDKYKSFKALVNCDTKKSKKKRLFFIRLDFTMNIAENKIKYN